MPDTKIDVSIIIVAYNDKKCLYNCISSIYKHTRDINFEIIVSDNASDEETTQMLIEQFPHVAHIKNHENIGFGRANNTGSFCAAGEFLFLLNSDTILLNNAVAILAEFLRAHVQCGAAGGNLFDAELRPVHSFKRSLPSIRWELNAILFDYPEKILYNKNREFNYGTTPMEVGYITGADFMIRHELWKYLDGFNPAFFMYYEDAELSWRVKRAGFTLYSVPDAKIMHLSGMSFSLKEQQELCHLASRKTYFLTTRGRAYYILVSILSRIEIELKILVAKLRNIDELLTFYTEKKRVLTLFRQGEHEEIKTV